MTDIVERVALRGEEWYAPKAEVHFKDGLVMFPPSTLELMLRREREKERDAALKREQELRTHCEALEAVVTAFINCYPCGVNQDLDRAYALAIAERCFLRIRMSA